MLYKDLAHRFIDSLQLQHLPVGLAFVEDVPQNIQQAAKPVPSACTFWRLAEQGVFYANAEAHQNCPIGMMTMGFQMPEAVQQRAQELVSTMASVQYFSPAEVSALPIVEKPHHFIVYGRLDQLPIEADVVQCIVHTQQAMLIAEALLQYPLTDRGNKENLTLPPASPDADNSSGTAPNVSSGFARGQVSWLQGGQTTFGRPTCAAIPRTLKTGDTSMSFGCIGARTYIGLTPAEMVLTIPIQQFPSLVERLHIIVSANAALAPFHQQQKATFPV